MADAEDMRAIQQAEDMLAFSNCKLNYIALANEVSRIHPEFSTPVVYAGIQKIALDALRANIELCDRLRSMISTRDFQDREVDFLRNDRARLKAIIGEHADVGLEHHPKFLAMERARRELELKK